MWKGVPVMGISWRKAKQNPILLTREQARERERNTE